MVYDIPAPPCRRPRRTRYFRFCACAANLLRCESSLANKYSTQDKPLLNGAHGALLTVAHAPLPLILTVAACILLHAVTAKWIDSKLAVPSLHFPDQVQSDL